MNKLLISLLSIVFLASCAANKPEPVFQDGLVLQEGTKFQEVYLLPDADFSSYQSIGVVPCSVSFRKNWLRDQNNSRLDLSNRITQKEVDSIKDSLGEVCTDQFSAALLAAPAYDIVEQFENGEEVLIVRPSIINLDINAPDTMSAGMSRSYTTSAGEMTLALELVDGTTGQVLARARDRRRSTDYGTLQWTSGVSNKADADRTLKRWAGLLRAGLDETTGR